MRTVEDIHWEACVQLFPQGNVDPSGNPLLAGCRKKIAQHCKRSHELKMSSSYSSGLNWLEQISNLHFIWKPIMSLHLQEHTWHMLWSSGFRAPLDLTENHFSTNNQQQFLYSISLLWAMFPKENKNFLKCRIIVAYRGIQISNNTWKNWHVSTKLDKTRIRGAERDAQSLK